MNLILNIVRFSIGIWIFFLEFFKNMRRFGFPKRIIILLPRWDDFRTFKWMEYYNFESILEKIERIEG